MAYNFHANQFNRDYEAKRLGNWEYPKWYPAWPRQRTGKTKVIARDDGHLLDGVQKTNPWGSYLGTWELPKKLTREYAEKQAAPPDRLVALWDKRQGQPTLREKHSVETQHLPSLSRKIGQTTEETFRRRNRSSSALDLRPGTQNKDKLEPIVVSPTASEKAKRYFQPGQLDNNVRKILEECNEDQEEEKTVQPDDISKELKEIPQKWCVKEQEPVDSCQNRQYLQALDKHFDRYEKEGLETEKKEKVYPRLEKPGSGKASRKSSAMKEKKKSGGCISQEYSGFEIAKRFHDDNLKHQPLPDMIDDPVFKALGSNRHPYPGMALDVKPNASAIGWRGYAAPGPTQCSKMKVYRPKTAPEKLKKKESRPKTTSDKRNQRFTQMDLAICWDLKPGDPSVEPKRSPHIDGSNGSAAPAVFAVVHPTEEERYKDVMGSAQAVAERIPRGMLEDNVGTLPPKIGQQFEGPPPIVTNKEAIMARIKPVGSPPKMKVTRSPDSINSLSTNAAEIARKNPKTAWTEHDTSKVLSERLLDLQKENKKPRSRELSAGMNRNNSGSTEMSTLSRKKHYQSSPNLATVESAQKNGSCVGSNCGTEKCAGGGCGTASGCGTGEKCVGSRCGTETNGTDNKKRSKAKKGEAQKTPCSGSPSAAKPVKIPKMRPPYAKRSYSIGTLIPPFSLWPDHNSQEYPEHWRLASVYQHSYKPIVCRRKPLLASVYQ